MATATTNLAEHVLGTYGQIVRSGPFYESDGTTVRDMTSFTVSAELYPPAKSGLTTVTGVGFGTTDGFIEYRIISTDLQALGFWTVRLYAVDPDERLASKRGLIKVVAPTEGT